MGERDAFGRDPDEDPLASLRGEPPGPPRRPAPDPRRPVVVRPGRRSSYEVFRNIKLVVLVGMLVLSVPFAVSVVVAIDRGSDDARRVVDPDGPGVREQVERALDEARRGAEEATRSAGELAGRPDAPAAPGPAVVGLQRGSFLNRSRFSAALDALRAVGPDVQLLRVAPERVDATVRTARGRSQVQVTALGVRILAELPGDSGPQAFPLSSIDPAAPSRLVRSGAGRLRRPTTLIDYVVLLDIAGRRQWTAYFPGGRAFSADAQGRSVRRVG